MAKYTPSMTQDTKTGVTCTEKGAWGGVSKKMKVGHITPLKGLRYVVGKTETKIIVETADTKTGTLPTED